MNDGHHPYLLPDSPDISDSVRRSIAADYEKFADQGLPVSLEEYLADHYRLDVSAEYAGNQIRNPWGKASGQLSMTARQVEEDVEAGLGFIVLKTVIAQDETGRQAMKAWAIKESRMVAEPVVGKSGEQGWTISWKGRGWWQSFEDYLQLVRNAQQIARPTGTLIVPSCKYHLPTPDEDFWKTSEYEYTTQHILKAWREHSENENTPMPLEKDFSPTLAGSDLATAKAKIIEWLRTVPRLIRAAARDDSDSSTQCPVRVGLKVFNALFDDDFQLEMLNTIHAPGEDRPDFYIFSNRLFDPNREFDGHKGIAYGGPDLSDRNLRVMSRFVHTAEKGDVNSALPWCATGNIVTGKMALEYALRGASSFQLHTFFQLPADQYRMTTGSKIQKALNELYFHPQTGFVVWMHHLADVLDLQTAPIRFRDVIGQLPRLMS
jgi:hypothetical protein